MDKSQLDALQSYIASVVRLMTQQGNHDSSVRLMLDSKRNLERAFGQSLDAPYDYGLLTLPATEPGFPDLL